MNKLVEHYLKRGYSKKIVMANHDKVINMTQEEALNKDPVNTEAKDQVPIMITKYNPDNPNIKELINKHWNIIRFSTDCGNLFPGPRMVSFRRNKNLKEMLVKSTTSYPPARALQIHAPLPIKRCTRVKCDYCNRLLRLDRVKDSEKKQTFRTINVPPHKEITCELSNVIYCISCKKCSMMYVGETLRPLRARLTEHLRDIRSKVKSAKVTPVSTHFKTMGHQVGHLKVIILEHIKYNNDEDQAKLLRKRRERFWMWKLKSLSPLGINHMD